MAFTLRIGLLLLTRSPSVTAADGGNDTSQGRRDGWVSQPDGRGTFDILWSCLITIFLCTWVSLHLNVPASHEQYRHLFFRKMRWMVQAIMAPEFVLAFAIGQKVEAKKSVEQFRGLDLLRDNTFRTVDSAPSQRSLLQDAGGRVSSLINKIDMKLHGEEKDTRWSIRHAFYANMGGFVLHPRESAAFPINAKQLHWLIKQGYVEYPKMTAKEVWDKSKADGFQKSLTCLQTGWFIIQIVGRAIQKLPITTLEITTLSFVLCTLVMFTQWANKPLDVESPTVLTSSKSIAEILIEAGPAASQPFKQTPLDFIDNQSPSWLTEVQPHLRFRTGPRTRPLPRLTNDRFPVIGAGPDAVFLFLFTMAYCGLHFVAWDFSFPSLFERDLWRAASVTIAACAFIFWVCETYQDGHRLGRWERWYAKLFHDDRNGRINTMEKIRRNRRFIPVWEVIVMTPVTVVYTVARTYIVVEVFLSQRSLPVGAFNTVQWSEFVPHF
ncbi:MAG: hypothetical protein L6R42_001013 [Xanthoria sp. 1 TBL-2021]|nr:MAG: hypothetical protein L6R42_001013 [Xanthoria sp. 1 TBL-2021]